MIDRFESNRHWWRQRARQRTYAFAKVTRRPESVEHAFSAPLERGGDRYYAFDTEEQRDAFVAKWPHCARACANPTEYE